ncbi:MAG: hypothetical protein P4L40_22885 [Terracidiphilus sp.]|nr:hypothetical protein [Terracidiphilus sp.]
MALIFESRGLFWFAKDDPPEGTMVPKNSMPGNLTIREDGLSRVALDGWLTEGLRSAIDLSNTGERLPGLIRGFLYRDAEFVLLSDLDIASTHTNFAGANREEIVATYCLRGCWPPLGANGKPVVQEFEIDLLALEGWIRPPLIRARSTVTEGPKITQTFEYWQERWNFAIDGRDLSVRIGVDHDFTNSNVFGSKRVEFSSTAILGYKSHDAMEFSTVRNAVMHLQEFFALIMGTYIELAWPQVTERSEGGFERHGVLYFQRHLSMNREVSITDLWTLFKDVKDSLGGLFKAFLQRREELGPGLYLYLACMRTQSMFPENRFTTLMTGIESLYRRDAELPQLSTRDQQRIERIISSVQTESDKKWLERKLASRSELSLEDRLRRLLSPLDELIEPTCLAGFAEKCAGLRNDITHFGGLRGDCTHSELMTRLQALTPALADLYHALLLLRIGFTRYAVIGALKASPASHKTKEHLKLAGLEIVGHNNLATYRLDSDESYPSPIE